MKPPATIRILHLEFEFRLVDEVFFAAANAYGFCDKKHMVLAVLSGLRPALTADCALHEIIHGIHFAIGAEDELNEEQIAMQFAGPLCMVLRDNPQLIEWLNSLLRPEDVDDSAYV